MGQDREYRGTAGDACRRYRTRGHPRAAHDGARAAGSERRDGRRDVVGVPVGVDHHLVHAGMRAGDPARDPAGCGAAAASSGHSGALRQTETHAGAKAGGKAASPSCQRCRCGRASRTAFGAAAVFRQRLQRYRTARRRGATAAEPVRPFHHATMSARASSQPSSLVNPAGPSGRHPGRNDAPGRRRRRRSSAPGWKSWGSEPRAYVGSSAVAAAQEGAGARTLVLPRRPADPPAGWRRRAARRPRFGRWRAPPVAARSGGIRDTA